MHKLSILLVFIFLGCKNEASESSVLSIIVSEGSEIKQEEYFNGSSKNALVNVQSITKSIISILIGQAIDDGIIENENVSISEYFPDLSEEKKSITIKHLLNHTSGLEWKGHLEHEAFLNSSNPEAYVLMKEMAQKPGTEYNYNSGGTHLLSIILTKASGKTTLAYAQEKLFNPLQINQISWGKLKDGIHDGGGFSLEMLPSDLVKIGGIFLGKNNNRTKLVSSSWKTKMKSANLKMDTKWGLRNSKHGYGWYSAKVENQTVLYSMGYGGQFILVVLDKELVIVTTHNHDTPNGIQQQVDFLSESFPSIVGKYSN